MFAAVSGDDPMSSQRHAALGFQFFLVGGFAWIAAALLAVLLPTVVVNSSPHPGSAALYAPNMAAAGAALGLGIGGGLCFLGAAILYGKEERIAVTRADSDEPANASDRGAFTTARTSTPP
jgi:hypothetical protein